MIGQHIFPLIVLCIARLLENLPTDLSAHDLHTYVYTYAHVYIHAQTHKYIHTYKQTDIMKVLSFLKLFFFFSFSQFSYFSLFCSVLQVSHWNTYGTVIHFLQVMRSSVK